MMKLYWNKQSIQFERVEWSGTDTQCSRQISATIASNPYDKNFITEKIKLGDIIQLYNDRNQCFIGVVTSREKNAAPGTMTIEAKDFMHYLLRSSTTKIFRNKSPEKITKMVCKEAGIKVGILAKAKVNIDKIFFKEKAIYDIIVRAYRKAKAKNGKKYMPVMDGKKLSVIEKGKDCGVVLEQGKDITGATYKDTTDNMVNLVRIFDDKGKKLGKIQNKLQVEKYGIYQSGYTKEKGVNAKAEAKSMLAGITKEATVEALGDIRAVAGKSIKIKDKATGLSGRFYITADTHTFEKGTHTMSLELAWENSMEEGAEEEEKKTGITKKTVSNNAIAYYIETGGVFHSTRKCSAIKGKEVRQATVAEIKKIIKKSGSNKGKQKYSKCEKCWR